MHKIFNTLQIFLVLLAFAAGASAQTTSTVSLSFTGTGTGNVTSLTLNGSGTFSPYGAATVVVTGGLGSNGLAVSFTFTFSDGDTLTGSISSASIAPDQVSGTANITGGTGAFNHASGTFSFTLTAPVGTTSSSVPFTLIGSGSVTSGAGTSSPPSILSGGILNAASYAVVNGAGAPVAPGSLVAIFTSTLATSAANFTTASLPPSLSGVSVTFNGVTAPMVTVSPTGANPYVSAQVPFEALPAGQTSATVPAIVTVNNTPSAPVQASIVQSAPGIFTIPPTGQGNAILVFVNSTNNTATIAAPASASLGYPTAPIPRGTNAFFYATGLGAMTPPVTDGSGACPAANGLCPANQTPTVLIGGISAPVAFAGQAPGYPGVFQINISIPQNAPTGNSVSLVVKSADGTVTGNTATIAVQ